MADSLNKKKGQESEGNALPAENHESVTISDIEKLFSLMRENEIAELEIEQHETKIHIVSKSAPVAQQPVVQYMPAGMPAMQMMPMGSQPAGQPALEAPAASSAEVAPQHGPGGAGAAEAPSGIPANAKTVLSPMVGTFYRAPGPDSPMFVKEGDIVNEESVLCIIEAMKLMNEIKAEARGKIIKILVENGAPVEFNQPLFVLEP